MNNISISIVIPVYKVERYISECLESVINQTFNEPFECILVDDCGGDQSIAIAEGIIASYSGKILFRIIHHDHNRGLSGARNTGINVAKGEYVYFLDSDDTIYPNCIKDMKDLLIEHPSVDIVQGNFVIQEVGEKVRQTNFPSYTNDVKWIRENLCSFSIPESACNRLVRKMFIVDNGIFFKEGLIQEDTEWTFQIQKHIKSIAFTNKSSYYYRINPDSIMHSSGKIKEANAFATIYNLCYSDLIQKEKADPCEIHYLAILSQRIYNDIGEDGDKMLLTNSNPFFRRLFAVMRIQTHRFGRVGDRAKRYLCKILERQLCNQDRLNMKSTVEQ